MRCVGLEPKIGAAYLIHPLRIATADNFLEYNLKKFLLPRAVRWPNLQRRLHMVSVFALEATHPARSRPFLPSEGHLSPQLSVLRSQLRNSAASAVET